MSLTLQENMEIIGRRNPFLFKYKVFFLSLISCCRLSNDGGVPDITLYTLSIQASVDQDLRVQSLVGTVYENCGAYLGDSSAFLVGLWLDNGNYTVAPLAPLQLHLPLSSAPVGYRMVCSISLCLFDYFMIIFRLLLPKLGCQGLSMSDQSAHT